jgi:hypothetical protein
MSTVFLKIIKNLLIAFVLISIGFSLGKCEYKSQTSEPNVSGALKKKDARKLTEQEYIHVYYMHSTFRCSTCNSIEKMTKELLETKYSKEIKDKKIIFSEIDFQSNINLAKKFNISSSCVVVAIEKDGQTVDFKRLDKVWTLLDKPGKFDNYISRAINSFMNKNSVKGDIN